MKKLVYIVVGLVCLLACVFIPYLLPGKEPVDSMAFDFGFNNRLALLLICASIFIWMSLGWKSAKCGVRLFVEQSSYDLKLLFWLIGIYISYVILVILFEGDDLLGIGESRYFVKYYYLLESGRRGYVDFAYGYGPAFLYIPFWLHKLTGISSIISYQIVVCFFHTLGLYFAYIVVMRLNIGDKSRRLLFVALWISSIISVINGNIHAQMLRFVLPVYLMMRVVDFHQSHSKFSLLFVPVSIILITLISPELSIVFCLSVLFYLGMSFLTHKNVMFVLKMLVSMMVMVGIFLLFPELFEYVRAFSSGVLNLPFTFNHVLITFILAVFILAFNLGNNLKDYREPLNLLTCATTIAAFGQIPACIGLCSHDHILWNGLFILPFLYVWIYHSVQRNLIKKFLLTFVLLVTMSPFFHFEDTYHSFRHNLVRVIVHWRCSRGVYEASPYGPLEEYPIDLSGCSKVAMVTRGCYEPDEIRILEKLLRDNKYDDLFYSSYVGSQFVINNLISEMDHKKVEWLLLRNNLRDEMIPNEAIRYEGYESIQKKLLWSLYSPYSPIRSGDSLVYGPFWRYVDSHYTVFYQGEVWNLYRRNL